MILGWIALGAAGAVAAFAADHGRTPYDAAFERVSRVHGVPANLLRAIARKESNMNPNARGPTNDHGLMQVTATNLSRFGIPQSRWYDPETSIDAGARYLVQARRELGSRFNIFTWPMAYNVGPDLQPRAVAERYASDVVWHWMLYDIGRFGIA